VCPESIFDALVDAYDAARPSYPDALFRDLERLAGRPLAGAEVVEVGAGTGIATRAMVERGADVVAVDVGAAMLARLRSHRPHPVVVRADGEALPFRDAVADLVCYSHSWHWVRVPVAAAEAVRVLRPGGCLALWWNDVDAEDFRWWQRQQERLEAMSPGYRRDYRTRPYGDELRWTGLFSDAVTVTSRWHRVIDIDLYMTWLQSKSYVAAIGERLDEFLDAERASVLRVFPDGAVVEPFRTVLVVATRR
jgi:SAM-dependent methyltransferase